MKKKKLIIVTSGLSLLIAVNCINPIQLGNTSSNSNISNNDVNAKTSLGPVKFDENYLHDAKIKFDPQLVNGPCNIDDLYYHNQNTSKVKTTGISAYESINTGKISNNLSKYHQWSYINTDWGTNLNYILIIELNFQVGNINKSFAVCVVPIIASNNLYTDLFNVYTTDQVDFNNNSKLPSVKDSIWTKYMTTGKKSTDNQRANGFHYSYKEESSGSYFLNIVLNNNSIR